MLLTLVDYPFSAQSWFTFSLTFTRIHRLSKSGLVSCKREPGSSGSRPKLLESGIVESSAIEMYSSKSRYTVTVCLFFLISAWSSGKIHTRSKLFLHRSPCVQCGQCCISFVPVVITRTFCRVKWRRSWNLNTVSRGS